MTVKVSITKQQHISADETLPERNTYTAEENRDIALHTELKLFNQLGYEEKSILRKKYKNQENKEANKLNRNK